LGRKYLFNWPKMDLIFQSLMFCWLLFYSVFVSSVAHFHFRSLLGPGADPHLLHASSGVGLLLALQEKCGALAFALMNKSG